MRSLAAFFPFFRLLAGISFAAFVAGCGLLPESTDETAGWSANKLYAESKTAQSDGAWDKAAKYLEKLEARYPYGRFAQQSQLELGYVYWKGQETGSALAACDRFIKLHPNHPAVDYAYYLKGIINFNEELGITGYFSSPDMSERDPKAARDAFDAFRELSIRFPNSKYTSDAIQRMNYLVNSMASHEIHVARYYIKRGAYVAAVNRAQSAIKTYPTAPANEEALFILVTAYDKLGMTELRDDADRILRKNFPESRFYTEGLERKIAWWKLW
ncbi:hypothetical protein B566_EDAN003444 [Ephemera danica]|nr:hypothetical protein B566_EDAN003444 [Ephemera danica]